MSGGEPRKLTDLPRGASPAVWSPSGDSIAFTSGTTPEDLEEQRAAKEKKEPPKKSDVRVVTRAVYRLNGTGWLDPKHHEHFWTVRVTPGDGPAESKSLTTGRYDETDLFWSRDGGRIFFTSNRVDEPYYEPPDANLYSIPSGGGAMATVIDIDGPIGEVSPSPDGSRFAFAGFVNPKQVQSHSRSDVFVYENGRAVALSPGAEFEVGSGIIGDQRPPRAGVPSKIVWTPEGKTVILATTEHGRSNIVRIDLASKRVDQLTSGDHDLIAYSATPDASRLAVTMGHDTHVGDLYLLESASRKLTQLTHVNDALLSELKLAQPEEIWYSSFDGKRINGWILKPPDFDPSKKYPFILQIHGGPHTAYGHTFTHEFQWMAAKGYVVLYTNPRGSTSYGEDFANVIQYRYPGDDYKDLMLGVDEVLRRGYVDEKRLGVTGGSGGGLLTNWTVTQTNRFAAAVSQRSVADWSSFLATTETHELSRSGKPSHRVERLQHIVNWFEKYLKGEKIDAYDLQ